MELTFTDNLRMHRLNGGQTNGVALFSAELYDSGLGFNSSWQPQIVALTSPLALGGSLVVAGSGFRGVSGGSCGNGQDSPADFPLVQLLSVENGQSSFLFCASSTNWSANYFSSAPVNCSPGYALATVFVNGIPSSSSLVNLISVPSPTAINLSGSRILANCFFQFQFTNTPEASFSALSTTNPSLPLSNWTVIGNVTEGPAGQFQFVDPQPGSTQRFYRVRSP